MISLENDHTNYRMPGRKNKEGVEGIKDKLPGRNPKTCSIFDNYEDETPYPSSRRLPLGRLPPIDLS